MRILVTGAAGYIGSVLCGRLLDCGWEVVGVDNRMYGQQSLLHLADNEWFEFVHRDVLDYCFVGKFDVVIPLAAIVGATAVDRWKTASSINVRHVEHLLAEMDEKALLIYPNTNSGYGVGGNVRKCTEKSKLKPLSQYARQKVQAETSVLAAAGDRDVIVFRLATVFGASPRMRWDLLVNSYARSLLQDGFVYVWAGIVRRNFVHVTDVCDAFIYAINKRWKMAGQVYNLGNDALNMTKLEMARFLHAMLGGQVFCDESEDRRDHLADPDRRDYVVSNEKLRKAGFSADRGLDANEFRNAWMLTR